MKQKQEQVCYSDRKFKEYFESLSEQERLSLNDRIENVVEKIILEWKKEKDIFLLNPILSLHFIMILVSIFIYL